MESGDFKWGGGEYECDGDLIDLGNKDIVNLLNVGSDAARKAFGEHVPDIMGRNPNGAELITITIGAADAIVATMYKMFLSEKSGAGKEALRKAARSYVNLLFSRMSSNLNENFDEDVEIRVIFRDKE